MDQAHEQRAQLLAIEGVLLLAHLHPQLLCGDVLEQDAGQLQQKPSEQGRRGQRGGRLSESTPGQRATDRAHAGNGASQAKQRRVSLSRV